jgi:hypothetical protein
MLSARFRAAVEQRNIGQVPELFREDAAFRGPVLFKPYEGRDQVLKVLQAAERVLGIGDQFRYVLNSRTRTSASRCPSSQPGWTGGRSRGIDKLTFDQDSLITELKVMIGPASALEVVGARMAEEFPRVGLGLPR